MMEDVTGAWMSLYRLSQASGSDSRYFVYVPSIFTNL